MKTMNSIQKSEADFKEFKQILLLLLLFVCVMFYALYPAESGPNYGP